MTQQKILEHVFFFGLLAGVGILAGAMVYPFVAALSMALIIATIVHPVHRQIVARMPRKNETLGALVSTTAVLVVGILPLVLIGITLFNEALNLYQQLQLDTSSVASSIQQSEAVLRQYVPNYELNLEAHIRQGLGWVTAHAGSIFAGTASAVFTIFITLISVFYFLRDGERLRRYLIKVMPLKEEDEVLIFTRLAQAVRSVTNGIVLVAIIQGTLTGFGLWLFGFENTFIWGVVAAFGALIPSVGTSLVFIPAVAYLLFTGDMTLAVGLAAWWMVAVGTIDNLLGPYLMGRGNAMHPFLILLSVLGGISVFGFIGFLLGPIVMSLFLVLLQLYSTHLDVFENE
jgi:predicted PurR-regulated permease PerM